MLTFLFVFLFAIIPIIGYWMLFAKAGRPGWASIIPIYGTIVFLDIAGKPWWWLLLFLIPFVNIVFLILFWIGLARSFGKSDMFALGMVFFPFIFVLILAFSDAKYQPVIRNE